jgi:hypothetical protein
MSAYDRLEQGVRERDPETMLRVRAMISRWAAADAEELQARFAIAFRTLMKQCAEGTPEDLDIAMAAIKCLTENELRKAFDKK